MERQSGEGRKQLKAKSQGTKVGLRCFSVGTRRAGLTGDQEQGDFPVGGVNGWSRVG